VVSERPLAVDNEVLQSISSSLLPPYEVIVVRHMEANSKGVETLVLCFAYHFF
jgi:hypothetical protein